MKKKGILWILLDLVFIIVFNVLFFILGGKDHPLSVWISYAFIHFSYLMLLITPLLIRKAKSAAVFGFSLISIAAVYFFLEFVVGLVFIIIHPDSFKLALVIQLIIAGLYLIMLFANMIANEKTTDDEERQARELQYIKVGSSKLKGIMDSVTDKKLRKQVEELYDLIHSSPSKSNDSVLAYEEVVLNQIDILEDNIAQNDISAAELTIGIIEKQANERNRKLKATQ